MMHKSNSTRNNNAKDKMVTCPRCGAKFNPDKGLDLAGLAAMINEGKNANRKEQKPDWAKNSRYYGTDICGYAYNPYMVRRWITAQFLELMNKYNLKIEDGIRHEYNYMYSIEYIVKEAKKMTMLEKRDPIAFEERKMFWSPEDMAAILIEYMQNVTRYVWEEMNLYPKATFIRIPGIGRLLKVIPKEKGAVHRELSEDYLIFNDWCHRIIVTLRKAITYREVFQAMCDAPKVKLPGKWNYKSDSWEGFKFHKAFIEGFKKSGAYYTLKNLAMFEDFSIDGFKGRKAVIYLENLLGIGYKAFQFYALLKKSISINEKV